MATIGRSPSRTCAPPRRRPLRRLLGRTWLRAFGWEIEGGAPGVERAVVVAYPHTSNWDFPFSLAVAYALDLDMQWLGKISLFRGPFGRVLRAIGGVPVDRSRSTNLVEAVVEAIAPLERVMVVISPEGTRSKVGRWKSGFYWIAVGAEVPIVLSFLDYKRRRAGLGEVFNPTGDIEADFPRIRAFYDDFTGKNPLGQSPVTLTEAEADPAFAAVPQAADESEAKA